MHAIALIFLAMIILMGFSFLTFEIRTKDSKTLSIVAMLSSLSAASRIFFAPLAQITPSDWITFSVGFCFGPSAGFVVGALTILISNLAISKSYLLRTTQLILSSPTASSTSLPTNVRFSERSYGF